MKLQSCLLCETVQFSVHSHMLILNSARDPFVRFAIARYQSASSADPVGDMTLAEDNVAAVQALCSQNPSNAGDRVLRHTPFHDYILHSPAQIMDVAVLNLLYQPGKAWMLYALQAAHHALRVGEQFYVAGAKERGIVTMGRHIEETFGNVETLLISKGHRVLRAVKTADNRSSTTLSPAPSLAAFADNELDDGTRLLLPALDVHARDQALDIGCGAGFIGLHIARLATGGHVTMVDASLLAVATARAAIEKSQLDNVEVLASDGAQAVIDRRFDLVVTNPPFHQGGVQSLATSEQFIREAAHVLRPGGRFYLVANRFLKYEPALRRHFAECAEVAGDTRYKVLRAR